MKTTLHSWSRWMAVAFLAVSLITAAGAEPGFVSLFDGKTLKGWLRRDGINGHTQIMRWHLDTDRIESFFNLHDLAVDDHHQLYLAENDNHSRSSYLWTATLARQFSRVPADAFRRAPARRSGRPR